MNWDVEDVIAQWDSLFSISYYDFRKRLRKVSVSILKEQCLDNIYLCLDWSKIKDFKKYGNQVYIPMDDDDIFILSAEDREDILKDLERYNAVLVTMYDGQTKYNAKLHSFGYTPRLTMNGHMCLSNNLIYKHDYDPSVDGLNQRELPLYHDRKLKRLHISEREDLKTSLHFLHPCSVSMLQRFMYKNEDPVAAVEGFKTKQNLDGVPEKFFNYIDRFLDVYTDLHVK